MIAGLCTSKPSTIPALLRGFPRLKKAEKGLTMLGANLAYQTSLTSHRPHSNMPSDRREFLKSFGGVTAAVVAGSSLAEPAAAQAQSAPAVNLLRRPPGRVQIGLFLGGADGGQEFAGWLTSLEGGQAVGDVVTEKVSPDHIAHKHIAGVKYEDITVNCGTGMSKAFYEWIKASFDQDRSPRSGAIQVADFNGTVETTLEFFNGLVSEIGFPALDASSKDAAKMTIKFSPEYTRRSAGGGQTIAAPAIRQKRWLVSNFKIEIDGADPDTSSVQMIDPIVVKLDSLSPPTTDQVAGTGQPVVQDVSDFGITLPESRSDKFDQWNQDLLTNNGQGDGLGGERNGTLQFFAPDLKTTYFTLSFSSLGAFKLTPDKVEAGGENIRRVAAMVYCEQMKFDYTPAASF